MHSQSGIIYANAGQYAPPDAYDRYPTFCIAPVAKGGRCSLRNESARYQETLQKARLLPHCEERYEALKAFVVSCCCARYHGYRLEDAHECLDQLILVYAAYISIVVTAGPHAQVDTEAYSVVPNTLRVLRSQRKTPLYNFRPYHAHETETITQHLCYPSDNKHAEVQRGHVYCFYIPSQPGHVKIGYTARHVMDRLETWRECYPVARLLKEYAVSWPWHVEQLVHLDLASSRRHAACDFCQSPRRIYHNEWFEVDLDTAAKVMQTWIRLIEDFGLLDDTGNLSVSRAPLVHSLGARLSGDALLKVLEKEAASLPLGTETQLQSVMVNNLAQPDTKPPSQIFTNFAKPDSPPEWILTKFKDSTPLKVPTPDSIKDESKKQPEQQEQRVMINPQSRLSLSSEAKEACEKQAQETGQPAQPLTDSGVMALLGVKERPIKQQAVTSLPQQLLPSEAEQVCAVLSEKPSLPVTALEDELELMLRAFREFYLMLSQSLETLEHTNPTPFTTLLLQAK